MGERGAFVREPLSLFHADTFQQTECDGGGLETSERTFAHAAVLAQDVAGGALALVRPQHVDAAEGAQQGVDGALVDVYHRARKRTHANCLTVGP